jgi:alkanesulfonate monooxygenase SsuD/methylene tetrahydromethanopterin reductase-like flavin-dependent oxidoreductase (luciferase family)/iron-sulfur cluster repair protein YtfE (RIC family)
MGDYQHDLLFGSFLTPTADQPGRVVALAQLSEELGLDLVTVQDHPYQARFLDTWTLLSVIAARTARVRVAPNVANLPLRPPTVLARSVATLDLLSGGRVELGLGAGAFSDAIAAVGGPRRSAAEAVEALEEAIGVVRAIWAADGPAVRVEGRHYRVRGAHPGPAPAHRVGIWLGAYKPRMLAVTGRLADGWLPSSPYALPEALAAMNRAIDRAAEEAGRRPAEIRRLYNISGRFSRDGSGFLEGPPALWAEQLTELTLTEGMSGYIVMGDDPELLRRFAAEVVPAVRELVEAERARPASVPAPVGGPSSRHTPAASAGGSQTGAALRAAATPDDGTRLGEVPLWDETTRPSGPGPEPGRVYSPEEQAVGRHLVEVHDHLRSELQAVRGLVDKVLAGAVEPHRAREELVAMTLRQNSWTMGAYCAAYCRLVTTHHTIEDRSVFPHLRRADPRLAAVIDRLEDEHRVIHEVIEGVDRALVTYVEGDDGAKALREAVNQLTDTLLSHLAYEERELVEPLARLGFY